MERIMFVLVSLTVLARGEEGNIEDLFWCEHTELSDQMTNCEKGNLHADVLRTSSTASASSGFVDYEELLLGATPTTCRQIDEYATQLMCKLNVMEECLEDGYKGLLPGQYSLSQAVRHLCLNLYDLNDQCLMDLMVNFGECMLGMGFDNPTDTSSLSPPQKTCKLYYYARDCVASTFRPCGSTALKIYRETMSYLEPQSCNGATTTKYGLLLTVTTLIFNSFLTS